MSKLRDILIILGVWAVSATIVYVSSITPKQELTLGAPASNLTRGLAPVTDDAFDLGSSTLRYQNLFLSASSTVGLINSGSTASSTFQNGINLYTGCFSVNGTCLVNSSGGLTSYDAFTHAVTGTSATTTEMRFLSGLIGNGSSTFQGSLTLGSLTASSTVTLGTATGLVLRTSGVVGTYTGVTCTNQFLRILDASGAGTCATVVAGDVDLADLTATNSTLTFSGAYDGSVARTIGLNLGNANTWTASQMFTASTTITPSLFISGNLNLSGLITASSTATSTFLGGLNLGVNPNGTISGGGLGIGTTTTRQGLAVDGAVSLCETRVAPSATPTFDWSKCPKQVMTMTANVTSITFVQGKAGTAYRLALCQDGTGGRRVSIGGWGSNILFATGNLSDATTTPGMTTKINTCNVFTFDATSATGTIIFTGSIPLKTY